MNLADLCSGDRPTARELKALLLFSCPDVTRTSLTGLLLADGAIWASDGHTAARIEVDGTSHGGRYRSLDGGSTWEIEDRYNRFVPIEYGFDHVTIVDYAERWGFDPVYMARLVDVEKAIIARKRDEVKAAHKGTAKDLRKKLDQCNANGPIMRRQCGALDPLRISFDAGRWQIRIMPRKI